jgi:asparagine N-glycosylation enzyme membrane subunit Stt3
MQRGPAVFWTGVCAALLLGLALRLHTRTEAVVAGRVRPLDSDSAYHLRRAGFAAICFPRTIQFDPMMNFPAGGVAIWPPLYDVALGLPATLIRGVAASPDAVARGAAWVPVAFGVGAAALAGLLGRRLYGGAGGATAALFVAVCPGHVLWSQYAHTDQNIAESFCGLLALLLFLRSREEPHASGAAARDAAAGLGLALAVLMWQGAIFWGAIFAAALVLEAAVTRRSIIRAAGLVLGGAAVVVAAATAAWLGWLQPPLTYISFGFFQPLFLAALCGGTAALGLALSAARRRATRGELVAGAVLVLAAAAATLPFARELTAGLMRGVGYVAGRTSESVGESGYISYPKDWLKGIFETRPLLADGPALAAKQLSLAFFLAPIAVAAWARRSLRGERPGVHIALVVWGAVTLFLALSQRLNVYYAAPLAAVTFVETWRWVRSRSSFAASALAAGVLVLPMAWGLRDELSSHPVPGSDFFATLEKMRQRIPHSVDAYDPALLGPPPFPAGLANASAVMAPWSMGHWILYGAELPVVANNFGYGFLDSIRFFLADSEEEALSIARRRHARWIVATDLTPRMNDYATYLGRPALLQESPQGLSPTAAYFRTLQSRLYDFGGKGAELPGLSIPPLSKIKLLFRSESAIRRGDRWIPRWVVFEIQD